ncbi:GNAT family N-acetyltransferase [Amycolatopsis thermoflava]|uniref:GNAT family N-acetyltransferase n=1 Tax=Amycolatopsis thermoflava TaxID=84480 RepID=UPI003816C0A2
MRLRADWLSRVVTVPYLPILGPVHPDQCTGETFAEVLAASRAGVALPYDKDRRWSPVKTGTALVDEITHCPDHTIVPVLTRRGDGCTVKTLFYGRSPDLDTLRAATRRWRTTYRAAHGRVIWFSTNPADPENHTRILLKNFTGPPTTTIERPAVTNLDDCTPEVTATFPAFAAAMAEHGFDFLRRRREAGHRDGPILIAQAKRRIVGAIGPLTITPDRSGRRTLLPQYFGVLPEHRSHGYGRALWHAVERWAVHHGAHYQLLQTRVGGTSDRLFQSEGLQTLGFLNRVHA